MPKSKKGKSKKFTFTMPENLSEIWEKLLKLGYVSNADLLRDMIREFAKNHKVI